MSYKQTTMLLLVAILLATSNPLANAQVTSNLLSLTTTGRVCCTSTGNCLLSNNGVSGVTVLINCTNFQGVSVSVGQGITDANGIVTVISTNLTGINSLIPCRASVRLPLNTTTCPVLATATGTLQGFLVILRTYILNIVGLNINVAQIASIASFVRSN